jgi:glycosyltransferase involved in cell wall biosynthesis
MKAWTPDRPGRPDPDLARRIGYEILGPVVQRWLLALHQHLLYHDDGDTVALWCARAGVRIRELHELFAASRAAGPEARMFWVSRVAVAKGVFARPGGREASVALLTREYRDAPLRDLVVGLMRHRPDLLRGIDLADPTLDAHGHNLAGWLTVKGPAQRRLIAFLEESSTAFDAEVAELLRGRGRALLVDSGWQGTTQALLAAAYPGTTWRGLYFGRILTTSHDPRIVPDAIGLLFEGEAWDPSRPETAFVRHRHLIECLLEPAAPSVEDVRGGPARLAVARTITACSEAPPDPDEDALYLHARAYVADHAGQSLSGILAAHTAAMPELARMILRPHAAEVPILAGKARSADLGKVLSVPVVIAPSDETTPETRIARALWTEGQAALEHPDARPRDLPEAAAVGVPEPLGVLAAPALRRQAERPRVAVITRTRDRPLLLRRAAASVAGQSFGDFVWTIVNDGGDAAEVARVVQAAAIDPRRIRLVSHAESRGMEAASNAGISACDSDHVVIHDDDDSWRPDFLERTVRFLDGPDGARYGGVTTHSLYVSEEVRGGEVIEHGSRPYNDWVRNVQLAEMACGNFFPPIAFLFRRTVWERVGGFNEALPVLGDWFFNMEVLLEDDIAVLPEPLARYHHRDRGDTGAGSYANSVIGGVSKHEEFAAVARNAFLRRHGSRAGIAASFALGYAMSDLRGRIDRGIAPPGAAPGAGGGTDDRLWCAAELNAALARRSRWSRGGRKAPVPADIAWGDLVLRLSREGTPLRQPPDFDEDAYLAANPDVAAAVAAGRLATGYQHYVLHGRAEGRPRTTR